MRATVAELTARCVTRGEISARRVELHRFLCRAIAGGGSGSSLDVEAEVNETLDAAIMPGGYVTYVAETDRLLGVLIADRSPRRAAWLRWIAVDADFRRHGIGTVLLSRFIGDGGQDGVAGRVNGQDPVACGFWTTQGWAPCEGREHIWMSRSSRPAQQVS